MGRRAPLVDDQAVEGLCRFVERHVRRGDHNIVAPARERVVVLSLVVIHHNAELRRILPDLVRPLGHKCVLHDDDLQAYKCSGSDVIEAHGRGCGRLAVVLLRSSPSLLGVSGFASTREMHTMVLPIPCASRRCLGGHRAVRIRVECASGHLVAKHPATNGAAIVAQTGDAPFLLLQVEHERERLLLVRAKLDRRQQTLRLRDLGRVHLRTPRPDGWAGAQAGAHGADEWRRLLEQLEHLNRAQRNRAQSDVGGSGGAGSGCGRRICSRQLLRTPCHARVFPLGVLVRSHAVRQPLRALARDIIAHVACGGAAQVRVQVQVQVQVQQRGRAAHSSSLRSSCSRSP